ncbi:hypothetical protein LAV78_20195 [Brucella intermedia]|uniref:hypothetical protein n=1 Tax=Brucella intermedia TaxID=94625 RepID=UPI001E648272|nr:hypothetical protein [Brucella intermedia]MCB4920843.1 hypothetical protein [Brucella intermedia]
MKTYGQRGRVQRHTAAVQIPGEIAADQPLFLPPTFPSSAYATTDTGRFPSVANKLLKAEISTQPLTVYIKTLGAYNEGDAIILVLDGIEIPVEDEPTGKHAITIDESQQGLVQMSLPAKYRPEERPYSLQYRFYSGINGVEGITSPAATFITDYTAPGRPYPGRLTFDDPTLVKDGLNAAKLAQLEDQVTALVPSYGDAADGDTFVAQLAPHMGGDTTVEADPVQIDKFDPAEKIRVTFPGDKIREIGDGLIEFRYYIADLAGNRSKTADAELISVFINSAIDDLAPPLVPLYHSPKPLDEIAARMPIYIDIPGNARLAIGDKILAYWGNTPLSPELMVTDPGLPVMLSIPVPYKTIQDEGNGEVIVTYKAYRKSDLLGEPAQGTRVTVDLIQPGGPDPDPETIENEALGAPILHASGWKQGDPSNLITAEQSKDDATFIVPWLNTVTPAVPSFEEHDQIDCYYVDRIFGTIEVTSNDVNNGKDLTIIVPATVIQDFGSGVMPIHYVTSRTSAINDGDDPVTNSAISVSTDVTVESAGDLPGGGDPLPLPSFDEAYVNFAEAKNGPSVTVPDYINKNKDDAVTIIFYANFMDTVPPRREGAEIVKARYESTKHVGKDDLDSPMKFTIPPSSALYLYPAAYAYLVYSVKNSHGLVTSTPPVMIKCDTRGNPNPPEDRDDPSYLHAK